MKDDFEIREYGDGIFNVTCPLWAPDRREGVPILSSWIVEGSAAIAAIDSGIPAVEGFADFLREQFGKPVKMINTHGHDDHTGCNEQFSQVYLNRKDWNILLCDDLTGTPDSIVRRNFPITWWISGTGM